LSERNYFAFSDHASIYFFLHASWTTLGDSATTPSPHSYGT